jgi:hypothetical protein
MRDDEELLVETLLLSAGQFRHHACSHELVFHGFKLEAQTEMASICHRIQQLFVTL